jgi:hypothetical protein
VSADFQTRCVSICFQARSKSSQIQQSQAKPAQRKSKKKVWIFLDWLRRIKRFQGFALTPWPKKSFCPFSSLLGMALSAIRIESTIGTRYQNFWFSPRKIRPSPEAKPPGAARANAWALAGPEGNYPSRRPAAGF